MAYTKLDEAKYDKVPFNIRVETGNMGTRMRVADKFGYNSDVGTNYETIWSPGGTLSYLSAADTMDVVSSDAADKGTPTAGTGARTIFIEGLDGSYNHISEEVTLNGVTPVTTTNSFLRVYRAYVLTAGTGEVNAGTITISDTGGASTQAEIAAAYGESLMAIFTVRSGYTGYITNYRFSIGGSDTAEVEIVSRSNGVIRVRDLVNLAAGNTVVFTPGDQGGALRVDGQSDIYIRGKKTGAGGTTSISASFDVIEIRDEEIYDQS